MNERENVPGKLLTDTTIKIAIAGLVRLANTNNGNDWSFVDKYLWTKKYNKLKTYNKIGKVPSIRVKRVEQKEVHVEVGEKTIQISFTRIFCSTKGKRETF